jgi:hypothetical protein
MHFVEPSCILQHCCLVEEYINVCFLLFGQTLVDGCFVLHTKVKFAKEHSLCSVIPEKVGLVSQPQSGFQGNNIKAFLTTRP